MSTKGVTLTNAGGIAFLTLNNPERMNALSRFVVQDLHEAAVRLAGDDTVRVVIVSGAGERAFCSGADLKERQGMSEAQVEEVVAELRGAVQAIADIPVPTIAAVRGLALGGGCEVALACDLRVLADNATIGLTETGWAIIPGAGGTQRLPQIVGPALARELIFTARRLSAGEAHAIGLANRVVPAAELDAVANGMAVSIANNGPLAMRAAKRAINGGLDLTAGLALEWEEYKSIIPTADRLEGLASFREKRDPVYRGE